MISLTVWQFFELTIGAIAVALFLICLLAAWFGRDASEGSLSGCMLVILLPLGVSGIYLILDALSRATWHV
ncbi:MAG: hypothetical protein JW900_06355 [Anaerolineae bacterium]|nr:hypothetical protein [Anaerolineae bacterium]